MNKDDLKEFEKQVRIGLRKKIDDSDHKSGIVVTTTDTPNPRIFIRFYMLFFMFEKRISYRRKNTSTNRCSILI